MENKEYYTLSQVADLLEKPKKEIVKAVRRGHTRELYFNRNGSRVIFCDDHIVDLVEYFKTGKNVLRK